MRKALALTKAARASSAMARASEDKAGMDDRQRGWVKTAPYRSPAILALRRGGMSAPRNAQ
ncbi:hypothetical protein GCM10008164_58800 [Achromobacter xylosoxidans]|nr:hypothetical protein GCM10008164_58800 [Achromobacter xylosoxidans]